LCAEAGPGQVLVSQRVFSAVDGVAVGESVGPLELRGFSRSVRAFGVSHMIGNLGDVRP
jgi:adenylate cyclase